MAETAEFHVSQGYEVLPPKPGKAYPILCDEWDHLKSSISSITDKANLYHTLGACLLGASLSTFIAILTGSFKSCDAADTSVAQVVAWAAVAVTLGCGALSLYFGQKQREVAQLKSKDVIAQMDLIEKRYPGDKDLAGQKLAVGLGNSAV